MRLLAIALIGLLVAPAASACSLFYQEFNLGDLDDDVVVTVRGQNSIRIDLETGMEQVLSEDFFPNVAAQDGYVFHQGQEGLGADCSGREYFEVLDGQGNALETWGAIDDFDVDGDFIATAKGETITIVRIGTWATEHTFTVSRNQPDDTSGFPGSIPPTRIALDAANERVAISGGDDSVIVHGYGAQTDTTALEGFDDHPTMDWHDGRLVIASRDEEGGATDFWIIEDVDTGAAMVLRLESDGRGWPEHHIAAGDRLLLQRGNLVVELDGTQTRLLEIPDDYDVGSIAADGNDAILLLQEATEYGDGAGVGIQRIRDGNVDAWFTPYALGLWTEGEAPEFQWSSDAPPVAATSVGAVAEDDGNAARGTPGFGVPLAAAGLLLVRRLAA